MYVRVEPHAGHELERTITALLNVTGVVHCLIEGTPTRPQADGTEIMGIVAERLRLILAVMAEHRSDDDLAEITGALAEATLLVADELGIGEVFAPPRANHPPQPGRQRR